MSCGPVNALQKLSSHAQVDRSLQHDAQQRQHAASSSSFRTQQLNTLDRDFQAQQHGMQNFDPMFNQAFQPPPHHMAQHQARIPASSSAWANDFSMSNMPQTQSSQQAQNWNAQFLNQQNSQTQMIQTAHSQVQAQQQMQHHLQQSRMNGMMYTPQLAQNNALARTSRMTEHQELHSAHLYSQLEDMDAGYDALDKEFENLEKEFQGVKVDEQKMEEPKVDIQTNNNAGFREAAKQVADVMQTSSSSKFANSRFLDLMNRVSAGQVSLNQDETKLVDQRGNDVHELSTKIQDPSHLPSQSGSHASLPDPLEFVKDDVLETPFQAAKLVGQQHGEKYTWDDVYDDYRNDDTSF